MLRRRLLREVQGPKGRYFVDTRLGDVSAVEDFGLQWREFDVYPRLQSLSYGHVFGRFLLPQGFFRDKVVVDLGCGNGRLGRFLLPQARAYVGVELSDAITVFEVPAEAAARVDLVRASLEDLPLEDRSADIVMCWGVLHHVRDHAAGLAEMRRILKPGGTLLIYVYPDYFAERENLNRLLKHVPADAFRDFCVWFVDAMRRWSITDEALATEVSSAMCSGRKPHAGWEVLQMFDGLGPEHHHMLEGVVSAAFKAPWQCMATQPGCFVIEAPA
jgi:SAM-dependent methyltransferase